jgi:hypothetical protein
MCVWKDYKLRDLRVSHTLVLGAAAGASVTVTEARTECTTEVELYHTYYDYPIFTPGYRILETIFLICGILEDVLEVFFLLLFKLSKNYVRNNHHESICSWLGMEGWLRVSCAIWDFLVP